MVSPLTGPRPVPNPQVRVRRTAAILVDVGYLCSQTAVALTGGSQRGAVTLTRDGVDCVHALLNAALVDGLDVLRLYWYDGAVNRIPNHGQRLLGQTPQVKVRLGDMNDGRQRGVDKLIQRDLTALSENKAVTDIVLVSGDSDMIDEFDAAGQFGVTMRLWGVLAAPGFHSQSSRLVMAADHHRLFGSDWVRMFASAKPIAEPAPAVADTTEPADGDTVPAAPTGTTPELPGTTPKPGPVPGPTPGPRPGPPTHTALRVVGSPASPDPHTGLTGDLPSCSPHTGLDKTAYLHAGRQAYLSLTEHFGAGSFDALRAQHPRTVDGAHRMLPTNIDAALLSACEHILDVTLDGDVPGRIWIRDGLWSAINADSHQAGVRGATG